MDGPMDANGDSMADHPKADCRSLKNRCMAG